MPKYFQMRYTNNVGKSIDFGYNNFYVNESDIYDYAWEYETNRQNIAFSHEIIDKSIPVTIIGKDKSKLANKLFETIDKDVREGIPGKLTVGKTSINGYFYGQEASNYSNRKIIRVNLKFVSTSKWFREEVHNFRKSIDTEYLDFDYDFEYDYKPTVDYSHITNHDYTASDFRLLIYGPQYPRVVLYPTLTVAGHEYTVNTQINSGEILEIDSMKKTITHIAVNGEKTNEFYLRNKQSYIFEKIPSGTSEVSYEDSTGELFDFDLILKMERSIPEWI